MRKHDYYIDGFVGNKRVTIASGRLAYLHGYLDAIKTFNLKNCFRLMRSDGRVMEEVKGSGGDKASS